MNPNSINIILVRPKFPENIGAVARAMKNMGLHRLAIVNGCSPLHMNAYKLASGAEEILERAEEYFTIGEAISDMGCVVGMTSREGKERSPLLTPRALIQKIEAVSKNTPIALVFGSEKEGLMNDELSQCHLFVKIPSSEAFPSLNLAQAVMILCYEIFQASGEAEEHLPPLAASGSLERMFEHMEQTLIRVGFLNPRYPKRMMRALRKIFGKSQMDEREVRILRGIWSQVNTALGPKIKE